MLVKNNVTYVFTFLDLEMEGCIAFILQKNLMMRFFSSFNFTSLTITVVPARQRKEQEKISVSSPSPTVRGTSSILRPNKIVKIRNKVTR